MICRSDTREVISNVAYKHSGEYRPKSLTALEEESMKSTIHAALAVCSILVSAGGILDGVWACAPGNYLVLNGNNEVYVITTPVFDTAVRNFAGYTIATRSGSTLIGKTNLGGAFQATWDGGIQLTGSALARVNGEFQTINFACTKIW